MNGVYICSDDNHVNNELAEETILDKNDEHDSKSSEISEQIIEQFAQVSPNKISPDFDLNEFQAFEDLMYLVSNKSSFSSPVVPSTQSYICSTPKNQMIGLPKLLGIGAIEGATEGTNVGAETGTSVGVAEGTKLGANEGLGVGNNVGSGVGAFGSTVGSGVGLAVGPKLLGTGVGSSVNASLNNRFERNVDLRSVNGGESYNAASNRPASGLKDNSPIKRELKSFESIFESFSSMEV